jgi:hypothetical protein
MIHDDTTPDAETTLGRALERIGNGRRTHAIQVGDQMSESSTWEQVPYPTAPHDESVIECCDGGAFPVPHPIKHRYRVFRKRGEGPVGTVQFQRGPVGAEGSKEGFFILHVLAICADWLTRAQASPYRHPSNDAAVSHIRSAITLLAERRDERARQGILGTVAVAPPDDTESADED